MNTNDDSNFVPDDVTELLGAYVLDAVDDVERRRVERAIDADPAVADEVERLRAGLDVLVDSLAVEPPAGLWEKIRSEVADSSSSTDARDGVRSIESARSMRNRSWLLAVATIVVVVVISGALVISRPGSDSPTDSIASMTAMANDAATKPGSRQGVLTDAARTMEVKVIVDPEGHGFVMTDPLPALPEGETYQLWAATDGTMVSLGMLGANPQMSLVPIDASVTELALTREPGRGSVSPTSDPMATGILI